MSRGEYHLLYPKIKTQPLKFQQYMRMRLQTFDYILAKIKPALAKKWCNLHNRRITEEERLVITLRLVQ